MTTTWYEVIDNVDRWIKDDWLSGNISNDEDSIYEYACETADSSEYVIYYHHQRELWANSAHVRSYEIDAIDAGCDEVSSIQQYCVYQAIADYIRETAPEIIEENSVLSTITEDKTIYVNGVSVRIPVLAIEHTPKEA